MLATRKPSYVILNRLHNAPVNCILALRLPSRCSSPLLITYTHLQKYKTSNQHTIRIQLLRTNNKIRQRTVYKNPMTTICFKNIHPPFLLYPHSKRVNIQLTFPYFRN
jgi:hypothetical protein